MKSSSLHVDVYKFYHGLDEIPKNCLIHHDGKDENGNYDKEKNELSSKAVAAGVKALKKQYFCRNLNYKLIYCHFFHQKIQEHTLSNFLRL